MSFFLYRKKIILKHGNVSECSKSRECRPVRLNIQFSHSSFDSIKMKTQFENEFEKLIYFLLKRAVKHIAGEVVIHSYYSEIARAGGNIIKGSVLVKYCFQEVGRFTGRYMILSSIFKIETKLYFLCTHYTPLHKTIFSTLNSVSIKLKNNTTR